MADYSAHYRLIELGAGDSLSTDDYAFTGSNVRFVDYLLYRGAEAHLHNGSGPTLANPATTPGVSLVAGTGAIPGGRTLRYKFSWVDAYGAETAASPEITINTPSPIATPGIPTISFTATGGTLMPGNYFYAVSAYTSANTLETVVGQRAYMTILSATTNKITLTLPSLPYGASGFNIYRRSPGSTRFQYLTSVNMNVATPPSTYVDTGSVVEDCNRTVPSKNTTGTNNSVVITIPGATPAVPIGATWKIYRTYVSGDYSSSLLHWVVEQTTEGSGIIATTYTDIGSATSAGTPLSVSQLVGNPSKVNMTDAAEIQGILPAGKNVVPIALNFTIAGPVTVANSKFLYVNEYDNFEIISARASLGVGYTPAVQSVIADVKWYNGSTWASIFNNTANRPSVTVGQMIGSKYTLQTADTQILSPGQALRVDVIQAGGGATPTDQNLMVTLLCYVKVTDDTLTHVWAAA